MHVSGKVSGECEGKVEIVVFLHFARRNVSLPVIVMSGASPTNSIVLLH